MVAEINEKIMQGRAFMTLDQPMVEIVDLLRVAARIVECFIEDGNVMIEYEVLKTPMGIVVETLEESHVPLDYSCTMTGMVNDDLTVSDLHFDQAYFMSKSKLKP